MNFIKKFIGTSPTDEIASIPSGKLFLTRSPQSPKGALECLYNDAFASIRQTTTPFFYQLCITRVYQEGEADVHGSSGFDDSDDEFEDDTPRSISDVNSGSGNSKDEWNFQIIEDLKIHFSDKPDGSKAIIWKDLNGDLGDKFEFIIDEEVKFNEIDSFTLSIYKCLYELKYHKSSRDIKMSELTEFVHNPKYDLLNFQNFKYAYDVDDELDDEEEYYSSDEEYHETNEENERPSEGSEKVVKREEVAPTKKHVKREEVSPTKKPVKSEQGIKKETQSGESCNDLPIPKGDIIYEDNSFELHLFDIETGTFLKQASSSKSELKIIELDSFQYTLFVVSSEDKPIQFNATFSQNMNPTFNYEHLSFIFNHFTADSTGLTAHSWLFKFDDFNKLLGFQNNFMKALWESLNRKKWSKFDNVDQDYVMEAFSNLDLKEGAEEDLFVPESSDEEYVTGDDFEDSDINQGIEKRIIRGETEEDDEEDEERNTFRSNREKNSNMSVGTANDRSYVVRGDKLGVFNNSDHDLKFQTTISNLKDLDGKKFIPNNTMLHQQDQYMIMSNQDVNDSNLYKMDLNRGTIVEQWGIDDKNKIVSYGPNSKFAQLTNEQTLTGIHSNGLFQIDPRLSGNKLVNDSTYKKYKTTNNKFLTFATTEQGYIALGSEKGDIRLYDSLGKIAKSALPSLGESIVGIDVSRDGRWILATCETYLLLIDSKISEDQRNAGSLGFTKSFNADKKPTPRRLALKPEHTAFIQAQSGANEIKFTKAYFNTGVNNKETSIVTSTGQYVIYWSLRKVLKGESDSYAVNRYQQNVIADNFKFGSKTDVIIALQDDVSMIKKSRLLAPTKVLGRKIKR
jgi:hypothetical protein